MAEEDIKSLDEKIKRLEKINELEDDAYTKAQRKLYIAQEQLELDIKSTGLFPNEIAYREKELKLQKKQLELMGEQIEAGKAVAEGLGGLIGLNRDFEKSVMGSIAATISSKKAQKEFGDTLKKTFSLQNIGYSILQKITQATMKLAYEQDSAVVSFNKQTGAARLYRHELLDLEANMFQHGITSADAAEAMGSLTRTVYGLRTMSQSSRTDLAETTVLLQELGVSADTTGANVHFMTRSLGMGVVESTKYQRELFTLAQEIGMPPAEMAEGFKSAQPKLAAFGRDAGKVFKKLATAARASGMEIQQMLGIVEQFDTFEGAATSVGKLNALLGGPFLNSMEMVMQTDPTERMRMLSQALNRAGKSFNQLTYYEKKSIAAAAGLADTNELALVMAGNFNGVAGGASKSQAEIQKLAAQTKEFNDTMEELMQVVRGFAIEMRPLIPKIKDFLESIQSGMASFKAFSGILATFATVLTGVGAAASAVQASLIATEGAALTFGAVIGGPIAIAAAAAGAFWLIYEHTNSLNQALGFTGLLLAGVAAAIAVVAGGFLGLTAPIWGTVAAIGALMAGLSGLIYLFFEKEVSSKFTGGIIKIGAAFMYMKDGVTVVASAISKMIGYLGKLIGMLKTDGIVNKLISIGSALMGSESPTVRATQSPAQARARAEEGVGAAALTSATVASTTTRTTATPANAASTAAQEVVVKLALGPLFERYFTAEQVLGPINKALNASVGGTE